MTYVPQVNKDHYHTRSYNSHERWNSYWHQIECIRSVSPTRILEIGPGNHTVADALKKDGKEVITVDIAGDIHPDVVASVLSLPFADNEFDLVSACEVLEHVRFEDVSHALKEIRRVTRRYAVIGLPHAGYVFSISWKIPLFRRINFIWKLPHFWKIHVFNGEHYWEMGKRGYPVSRITQKFKENRFRVLRKNIFADDPAHYFFLLEKT